MKKLQKLFDNNKEWISSKLGKDPDFFRKMADAQSPDYLWIGCSDSRVPANEIVGLEPGELFVHRNVANLALLTDLNVLSVLQYAIEFLKVKHIIVCGHYGCGGVKAAMSEQSLGLVDNWLYAIRDTYSRNREELDEIRNPEERYRKLIEINVREQVRNVCHTTIVQSAWAKDHEVCVHGWVYDLETGLLKDLNCCITGPEQLEAIYRINR